jgi:hypothetical protein
MRTWTPARQHQAVGCVYIDALVTAAGGRVSDITGAPIDYRGSSRANDRGLLVSLVDTEGEPAYRAYRPGEVDGNGNHPGDASWKGSARCPPTGRRERRGRTAGRGIPADRSTPRGARDDPGHQDARNCRGSPPTGHPPSARGEPTRTSGCSSMRGCSMNCPGHEPASTPTPGPISLHLSQLRAHRGHRGTGGRTALAGAVKTRGGPHWSHDHASPDRLLRSLPGVPDEGRARPGRRRPAADVSARAANPSAR